MDEKKVHYIAMGGEHGCMPDNCQAYESQNSAIEGLDAIYELTDHQKENLRNAGVTSLNRDQGGAYCEVADCECDSPWEHGEGDSEENWPEYKIEEEEEEEL